MSKINPKNHKTKRLPARHMLALAVLATGGEFHIDGHRIYLVDGGKRIVAGVSKRTFYALNAIGMLKITWESNKQTIYRHA